MAKLTVPFRSSKIGDSLRPYIHVSISCPKTGRALKAVAIVDTGADECAFPIGFSEILGFDLNDCEVVSTATAAGPANTYPVDVNMKAFADGHEIIFPIDHVKFINGLHVPILGVRTFLRFFRFEIDYYLQEFTLEPNGNAKDIIINRLDQISYAVDDVTLG